jgi:hypothetical protein
MTSHNSQRRIDWKTPSSSMNVGVCKPWGSRKLFMDLWKGQSFLSKYLSSQPDWNKGNSRVSRDRESNKIAITCAILPFHLLSTEWDRLMITNSLIFQQILSACLVSGYVLIAEDSEINSNRNLFYRTTSLAHRIIINRAHRRDS